MKESRLVLDRIRVAIVKVNLALQKLPYSLTVALLEMIFFGPNAEVTLMVSRETSFRVVQLISMFAVVGCSLTFTGCGGNAPTSETENANQPNQQSTTTNTGTTTSSATDSAPPAKTEAAAAGTMHGVIKKQGDKTVLTETPDGMVFTLSGETVPADLIGKSVMVNGHIDHQSKVIHIHKIDKM